jgi:ribosomal protein S6
MELGLIKKDKHVKRYEALVILHNPTKEDGIKEAIDLITEDIKAAGGQVDTVQKMDRKTFSRVVDKRVTSGFYVNLIFQVPEIALAALLPKVSARPEVYRVTMTNASRASALEGAVAVGA